MRNFLRTSIMLAFALSAIDLLAQTTYDPGQSGYHNTPFDSVYGGGPALNVYGCIQREQSDFFLVPKSGGPIRLRLLSPEDLGTLVGHLVRVHGNDMNWAASGLPTASANMSSEASAQPVGAVEGSSPGGALHTAASSELEIDKVTVISANCPADWNSAYRNSGRSNN